MKKAFEDMQPEYDFSHGVRGKYAADFRKGAKLVTLEPDIAKFFSDSASVNDALRILVKIAKRQAKPRRRQKAS
jgi:hypothetical protein